KNSVVNSLLRKNHTPETSSFFTEFRTGNGLADLVVANGTTTSYEIKTELDSLTRLSSQVDANLKMFEKNYVVTYEKNLDKVSKIVDSQIGLLTIDKDGSIVTWKKAQQNFFVDPTLIFD